MLDVVLYKQFPFRKLPGKLQCSEKPSRNSCHESNTFNPNLPSHIININFCIIFKLVQGSIVSSDLDTTWNIWSSNLVRNKRTIHSPKHPDQLQHPPSLQINKNQMFFSGSKLASADSLTTHIYLKPRLKISGAIPPLNLSASMARIVTTSFYPNLLPMYITLNRSHPFWSHTGTFLYITYPLHAHYMNHLFHLH